VDRDGQTSPVSGNGNFRLPSRLLGTSLGIVEVPDASLEGRHEFRESPPGKAGFRISGHLLGSRPLFLDEL
jgi:hypothetical protein